MDRRKGGTPTLKQCHFQTKMNSSEQTMKPNTNRSKRLRRQYGKRFRLVTTLVAIAAVATGWTCDASPTFGRRVHTSSTGGVGEPVVPLRRKMHSWLIRNGSQSKISATMRQRIKHPTTNNAEDRNKKSGSFMTTQHPTKERLFRWFGMEGEDPNQLVRCMMMRNEFNHNICGITNPFLKILPRFNPQREQVGIDLAGVEFDGNRRSSTPLSQANTDARALEKTMLTSRSSAASPEVKLSSSKDVESSWWPSLQITQNQQNDGSTKKWGIFQRTNQNNSFRKQDWRILTYRKRVGRGKACYEKVRDAALDWEFQSADGSTGMLQVPDCNPNGYNFDMAPIAYSNGKRYSVRNIDDDDQSNSNRVQNTYTPSSYRSLGSRRLVSFASKSLPSFLRRRIYSINPVMVVYDVVDQRAPDGQTTFTSTAYATLKGHFLRGEERVTVALRDGSQDVEVEILSISRPGPGIVGKTLWPFIGNMQSKFFKQQLHHLSQSGLVIDAKNTLGNDSNNNIEKITKGSYPLI